MPQSVRKAAGFPANPFMISRLRLSAAEPPRVWYRRRKARGFPHGLRRSRRANTNCGEAAKPNTICISFATSICVCFGSGPFAVALAHAGDIAPACWHCGNQRQRNLWRWPHYPIQLCEYGQPWHAAFLPEESSEYTVRRDRFGRQPELLSG